MTDLGVKCRGPRDLRKKFYKKTAPSDNVSCWEWRGSKTQGGYGILYHGRIVYAHRVSYELHNGPIPQGMMVRHTCDNPGCVNPQHLLLGDGNGKLNAQDMVDRGRQHVVNLPGETNPSVKLTEGQVQDIRRSTLPQRVLATQYGVSQSTIWRARRTHWRHVHA